MFNKTFYILALSVSVVLTGFFVVQAQSLTSIDFVSPVGSITGEQYTGNSATASSLLSIGTACEDGYYATGIDVLGNAICEAYAFLAESDPKVGTLSTNYLSKWNGSTLANSLIFDNGTSVGIGTISPETILDIDGMARNNTVSFDNNYDLVNKGYVDSILSSEASTSAFFIQNGNTFGEKALLGINDEYALGFKTNGTERVTIDTEGKVGIGTDSPLHELDVNGAISSLDGSSNGYYIGGTQMGRRESTEIKIGVPAAGAFLTASTWDRLLFTTNNLERMRIDTSGNIGMGTTEPEAKLDVRTIAGGYNLGLTMGPDTTTVGDGSYILFKTSTTAGYGATIGGIRSGTNAAADLVFKTGDASSLTESLRINSSGNVGIGDSSPITKLLVNGMARDNTVTFNNTYDLVNKGYVDSAVTAISTPGSTTYTYGYWNLTSSGAISNRNSLSNSVGINTYGTTGLDDVSFAVAQGQSGSGLVYVSSSNLSKIIGYSSTNFSNSFKIGDTITPTGQDTATITWISTTSEEMLVEPAYSSSFGATSYDLSSVPTGGSPRFVVKGSGSVGINTMDPQASLHISSSATNESSNIAILVADSSSTPAFKVDRDGKVTIGSSSAEQLLNIGDGKIYLGSTATSTEVDNMLYNAEGELYWGETLIASASSDPWKLTDNIVHPSSSEWKIAIGSSTEAVEALNLDGRLYLSDTAIPTETANRLYSSEGKLYWDDLPVGADATTTWALEGDNLFASSTAWNIALGSSDAGVYKLNVTGDTFLNGTVTVGSKIASYNTASLFLSSGGTRTDLYIDNTSGRVALGSTASNSTTKLDVNTDSLTYGLLVNGAKIGELAEPLLTTDAATKNYVDTTFESSYLALTGGTMTGDIDMSSHNITGIDEITAYKLNVNVVDPLYTINGVNYATFGSSFAGGLKEEYTGKLKINNENSNGEYEYIVDFDKLAVGGDLWLWRQVISFSKDNVEVIITPYGGFANVYYLISDNKIIFRSNVQTEISYRLTGRRFDWKKWPTITSNQETKGMFIR